MIIGEIMAVIVAIVLFCIYGMQVFTIGTKEILSILIGGIFIGIAVRPYLVALKGERVENIIPLLQTIPLFCYVFANLLLGEVMSVWSIVLMIATVGVTILFNRNFQTKTFNRKAVFLMLLSALLYGLSFVSFKF
ncbi:MAG: hypothetical protein LBU27_05260 [Candidatus Peribacteria bacterium]|nr:hypothetical protein [Candidatus Peribacteria bacterium]